MCNDVSIAANDATTDRDDPRLHNLGFDHSTSDFSAEATASTGEDNTTQKTQFRSARLCRTSSAATENTLGFVCTFLRLDFYIYITCPTAGGQ